MPEQSQSQSRRARQTRWRRRGATAVEYCLVASAIGVAAVGGAMLVCNATSQALEKAQFGDGAASGSAGDNGSD